MCVCVCIGELIVLRWSCGNVVPARARVVTLGTTCRSSGSNENRRAGSHGKKGWDRLGF